MGNIINYVTVTVSKNSVGITRAGFGTLLILSQSAAWVERTRTYSDFPGFVVDFPVTTSPEYRAASAYFGQNPSPKKLKVGRRALKSTLVYSVSVIAVKNNYTYQAYVSGQGFVRTLVSFTSSGSATDANIIAGLVIAANAVAAKNYTATGAASPMLLTASAAGNDFHVEVLNGDDLKVSMTHADPGIATDLAAIALADADWYMVWNSSNSLAEGPACAAWVEANKKTFIMDTDQTDSIITVAAGATDVLKVANTAAYTRTLGFWHHRLEQCPGAGLAGRCLWIEPGGETWADKTIASVDPTLWMTDTHRANLIARKANGYEQVAGIGVTFFGTVASGEYLDVTRFIDWFVDDASKRIFGTKVANSKISFDDEGIRKIANDLRASFTLGVEKQGFVKDTIVLTVPLAADVPSADKLSRTLNGLKGFAQLAGAVQIVNLAVNVVA